MCLALDLKSIDWGLGFHVSWEVSEEGLLVCSGDAVGSKGTSVGCDTRTERRNGGEELIVLGGDQCQEQEGPEGKFIMWETRAMQNRRLGPKGTDESNKTTAGHPSFKGTGKSKQSGAV